MAETKCLVPGCDNPCGATGPRFARLLCPGCRAAIPPGIYAALAVQEIQIGVLAEQCDVVREVLWEMEPERLVDHMSRVFNERLFLDVNFANRLLIRAKAETFPSHDDN